MTEESIHRNTWQWWSKYLKNEAANRSTRWKLEEPTKGGLPARRKE